MIESVTVIDVRNGKALPGKDIVVDQGRIPEVQLLAAFDKLQAMQVDFVKITDNTLKQELFLAALREAQRRKLRTSAHVPIG